MKKNDITVVGYLEQNNALEERYIEERKFLPMYHGKPTDTLSRLSSRDIKVNDMGKATVGDKDLQLTIPNYEPSRFNLGVNTSKLLNVGVAFFTSLNHHDNQERRPIEYEVHIPLKEYAIQLGKEVEPKGNSQKEKRRANNKLKDFKKDIKRDLETLSNFQASWKETNKGEEGDFMNLKIVGSHGIKDGYIYMAFDPAFANYLITRPITQLPIALISLDSRHDTAYSIGLKLSEHWNNDTNQKAKTYNRLKIENVIKSAGFLDTFESLQEKGEARKWERYIKDPIEKALDMLCGTVLEKEGWYYTGPKGKALANIDEYSPTTYQEYKELYLTFSLKDPIDHKERIAKKRRHQEKQERKKNGKSNHRPKED